MASKFVAAFEGKDMVAQVVTDNDWGRPMGGVIKLGGLGMLGTAVALARAGNNKAGVITAIVGAASYVTGALIEAGSTETHVLTGNKPSALGNGYEDLKTVSWRKDPERGVSGFGQRFWRFLNPLRY